MKQYTDKFLVKEGKKVNLKHYDPAYKGDYETSDDIKKQLEEDVERLKELQAKLYAHNRFSLLVIFQAMDAAGKDGAISHVMSGINPQGCQVFSFKHPSDEEYDHDFLWRYYKALPEKGRIGIFNRSQYENVLICKVHPEFILAERHPGIETLKQVDHEFWHKRYKQINRFEKNITQNGTVILKFFLQVSKHEQGNRFLERIDNPEKNWKFSFSDIDERKYWTQYQKAYEDAISHTSTEEAPWYIIPADNKWFTRAMIANIIAEKLESLPMAYPELPAEEKQKLADAKAALLAEMKHGTGDAAPVKKARAKTTRGRSQTQR